MDFVFGTTQTPHESIRSVCDMALAAARVTPTGRPGSPRRHEISQVRSTPRGGGTARKEILDLIADEAPIIIANTTMLAQGVADCLEMAALRPEHSLNVPAASTILRSEIEVAAQLAWMLDDQVDAHERCRRYLRWRFHDLSQQRKTFDTFQGGSSIDADRRNGDLDKREEDLGYLVRRAGWHLRPSSIDSKGRREPAALLKVGSEGSPHPRPDGMIKISAMVPHVVSSPSFYPLISAAAHGARWAQFHGVEAKSEPDAHGMVQAHVPGFGLPVSLLIMNACLGVLHPARLFAGWHGDDTSRLHDLVRRIFDKAKNAEVQ